MKRNDVLNKITLVSAVLAVVVLTSCIRKVSDDLFAGDLGKQITKTVDLPKFDKLSLDGIGTVYITQGKVQSVKVSAPEKVMKYITTEVVDGRFTLDMSSKKTNGIHFKRSNNFGKKINVYITVPKLTGIEQSGVCNVHIDKPFKADHLSLDVSGVGKTEITGLVANNLSADISGVGGITMKGLCAKNSSFDVSGVGSVSIDYSNSGISSVDISGVGSVNLTGTLKQLDTDKSGVGSLSNHTQLIK